MATENAELESKTEVNLDVTPWDLAWLHCLVLTPSLRLPILLPFSLMHITPSNTLCILHTYFVYCLSASLWWQGSLSFSFSAVCWTELLKQSLARSKDPHIKILSFNGEWKMSLWGFAYYEFTHGGSSCMNECVSVAKNYETQEHLSVLLQPGDCMSQRIKLAARNLFQRSLFFSHLILLSFKK